jgi:DNA-binding response OmpR family regulator
MEGKSKKILLVEDDGELRAALRDRLSRFFNVLEAADGEAAVTACLDHRPNLIILDLLLPKLDGFKVLERIRKYPDPQIAGTHVVVLSNLYSEKDILQAQGLKIDEYFVKSHTNLDDVVRKVNEIGAKLPS